MFDLPHELPTGWKIKTVEELVIEGVIEKPLDGNHGGTHPKSTDYVENGVPFVMASDLVSGRVNFNSCKFITEKQALALRKGFSRCGDVLISHKATIGRTAIVQKNKHDLIMLTPQVTYYRVKDKEKLSNIYLKAFFDSSFFQSILGLWAGAGSTRAYLGITAQLKLPIIIPPLNIQLSIANHASAINNKIELNRQTNQTLEQIAQAMFKSWFVDFDPVRAKIAANTAGENAKRAAMAAISGKEQAALEQLQQQHPAQYQQLQATADLFPDNLINSELGEIPEGWGVKSLGEVTSAVIDHRGKTPLKLGGDWAKEGYPAISAKNIKNGRLTRHETIRFLDEALYSKWMKVELEKGDIFLTSEAPLGEMYFLTDNTKYCLSQRLYALRADNLNVTPSFLYLWLQTPQAKTDLESRATGTTVVGIRQSELKKVNSIVPTLELLNLFENVVFEMFEKINKNETESQRLADLRDLLLPRLLSGKEFLAD